MKKSTIYVALFLSAGACAADLTAPLPSSLWFANDVNVQAAIGPAVGDLNSPNPSWGVAQWAPSEMRLLYTSPGGWSNYNTEYSYTSSGKWFIANSWSHIGYNSIDRPYLNGVYTLAQNGNNNFLTCWEEYDIHLLPKGPLNSFGHNARFAPDGIVTSKPLSQLNSLLFDLGISVTYESITPRCGGVDFTNYALTIYLNNTVTGAHFYYNIIFRSSKNPNPVADGSYTAFVDVTNGNIGIDDYIVNLASYINPPYPGGPRIGYNNINFLPRLKEMISKGNVLDQGGTNVMFDSDLSHWVVKGVLVGQAIWGGVISSSEWDSVKIKAY